jgi:hypothetical protein
VSKVNILFGVRYFISHRWIPRRWPVTGTKERELAKMKGGEPFGLILYAFGEEQVS